MQLATTKVTVEKVRSVICDHDGKLILESYALTRFKVVKDAGAKHPKWISCKGCRYCARVTGVSI